jgi:cytochrome c oxidase subunit 2
MMDALFPPAASAHAGELDRMIDAVHVLMLLLFIGWILFFFYAIFRFRASRNPKADYVGVKSKTNSYLEVGVAVAEGILLLGFSIPAWSDRVDDIPAAPEAIEVRVVSQQFAWNIWYPGADGMFGQQNSTSWTRRPTPSPWCARAPAPTTS